MTLSMNVKYFAVKSNPSDDDETQRSVYVLRSALRWCITKILASATDQSEHSEVFWLILMEYLGTFGTLIRHFGLKLLIG